MASLLTLSVAINVAHAATATLLGHVVAATPPLVLLVAVEGLLREQRRVARQIPSSTDRRTRRRRPTDGSAKLVGHCRVVTAARLR